MFSLMSTFPCNHPTKNEKAYSFWSPIHILPRFLSFAMSLIISKYIHYIYILILYANRNYNMYSCMSATHAKDFKVSLTICGYG